MNSLKDYKNTAFDIVVVAGQSNAEGYGVGSVKEEYLPDENICFFYDDAEPHYENSGGKDFLALNFPAAQHICIAEESVGQEGKVGKLSLTFAKEYMSACLPAARKLLIVNAAVGGTGFCKEQWTGGGVLYERMLRMVKAALSLNPANKAVALLWHQGECDAFENPEFSPEKRQAEYYKQFKQLITSFKSALSLPALPFVCGGLCGEWYHKNQAACDAVLAAQKRVCREEGGAFAGSEGLLSNNEKTKNGDDIHFCREALYELGRRYFAAYKTLSEKI